MSDKEALRKAREERAELKTKMESIKTQLADAKGDAKRRLRAEQKDLRAKRQQLGEQIKSLRG